MGEEYTLRMTVSKQVDPTDGSELFDYFKTEGESIIMSLKQTRDRVLFPDRKVVIIDFSGLTERRSRSFVFLTEV